MNNRDELIKAISSGDVMAIKEVKENQHQQRRGKTLIAHLNKDNTWHISIIGMYKDGNQWKESDKYKKVTGEAFAALIVKYDYQVMAESYFVNCKFPDTIPDPTETPERKYQKILEYLKEIPELLRKKSEVYLISGSETPKQNRDE